MTDARHLLCDLRDFLGDGDGAGQEEVCKVRLAVEGGP